MTPLGPLPGSIAGTVTDANTTNPIENVHVVAEGTAVEDYTDINGDYTLADLEPGTYNVTFTHVDYSDLTVNDVEVVSEQVTPLDVQLTPPLAGYEYYPGDANMGTGQWPPQVIGGDVTYLVGYFRGINQACLIGDTPFYCSGDANGDCSVIGSDVTKMVSYFRGLTGIDYCPDYEPIWLSPDDFPTEAPSGWPNCLTPPSTGGASEQGEISR